MWKFCRLERDLIPKRAKKELFTLFIGLITHGLKIWFSLWTCQIQGALIWKVFYFPKEKGGHKFPLGKILKWSQLSSIYKIPEYTSSNTTRTSTEVSMYTYSIPYSATPLFSLLTYLILVICLIITFPHFSEKRGGKKGGSRKESFISKWIDWSAWAISSTLTNG